MFIAIACDETTQFGLSGFEVLGVPDVAELFADLFSDLVIRRVVYRILGQVELASLAFDATEDGPSGRFQSRMVVGDDELGPNQAPILQALQEIAPVHFGLRELHGDPQNVPPLILPYADRCEHRCVAYNAVLARLFA